MLLGHKQLAELGILPRAKSTLWRWIRDGKFPAASYRRGLPRQFWDANLIIEWFPQCRKKIDQWKREIREAEAKAKREYDETHFVGHDGRTYEIGEASDLERVFWGGKKHIVVVLADIFSRGYFSHLPQSEIAAEFALTPLDRPRQYEYGRYSDHVPIFDVGVIERELVRKYGLHCCQCDTVKIDVENFYGHVEDHWRDHGLCEDCAISRRAANWESLKRDREARALQRRLHDDADAAREKREAAREAAEKKRRLEKAAYQAIREMGLLPTIEAML